MKKHLIASTTEETEIVGKVCVDKIEGKRDGAQYT